MRGSRIATAGRAPEERVKAKRAHAGYSREEWRRLRGFTRGETMPPSDPAPRDESDILREMCEQLEAMWRRLPGEFAK